jgi:hypothetical protein
MRFPVQAITIITFASVVRAQPGSMGPAAMSAGATHTTNGSSINIGQTFYGIADGGGRTVNMGIIPVVFPTCYANCDGSTVAPVLNANDFECFLNRFAAGDSFANCDGSSTPPTLNANDFECFLNAYAAGCP